MNEFSPEQPQAARQFSSSCAESHAAQREESGLSIEPTPAESRQATMLTDATDMLANGEIGAEAPAGQHTYEQAGSHDCELVVAPTGQGITASLEARAGRTLLPAESIFVNVMNANLKQSLTPGEEEVQKPASAPSVQPQSSNGCTPEVASGSPVSTLSNTSENKSEGVNLPAAAEGEPSAEAEFGSSAATNSNQSKAMKANQIEKVSSVQAEEDAQVNTCEQTVQPSVETEQIASPQAELPSAVSTDSINPDAAAEAPASAEADNNNSNTTTNMSTNNDTPANGSVSDVNAADVTNITPENAVALVSEGSNQSSSHPDGELVNPELDTVVPTPERSLSLPIAIAEEKSSNTSAAGTVLSYQPAVFTVPVGGALMNVSSFQVDDWGFLGAVPVGKTRSETRDDCKIDCRKRTGNQGTYGGHTRWGGTISNAFLPPGEYILLIEQENEPITAVANASYGKYDLTIEACLPDGPTPPDDTTPPDEPGKEPEVCPDCGCGNTSDGDADSAGSAGIPGDQAQDICSPSAEFGSDDTAAAMLADSGDSPMVLTSGLKPNSVWQWKLSRNAESGIITITPPYATPLHFLEQSGNAMAILTGGARKYNYALQLQDDLGNPCMDNTPTRFCLKNAQGIQVCFNSQGDVMSVLTAEGRQTTTEQHAAVVYRENAAGYLESVYSATEGLMRASISENGATLYEWFAPQQVTINGEAYEVTGLPYKTESVLTTLTDGVKTMTIIRQQQGLPAHTLTRVENGNTITITKGEGDEAIVRTFVKNTPADNLLEEIESVSRVGDEAPVSCSRTLRCRTAGGWLTLETTEAFGTPLARTTYYVYDAEYRLQKVLRPDGAYTEYEYDADGRVTKETTPWGNGGKKRTRYVYNANSARFYDNRPIKVYTDYQEANSNSWLNIKVVDYTYETTPAVERTTSRTYAAGVSHQQVTIEETFGTAAEYAYAVGKPKFSQAVNGVQTYHEYEATTVHNAIHMHSIITKANGELVAAQSRKTEEFIAADDTVTFEQESIWDGENWLLLSTTAFEYDEQKRVVRTTRGNGRSSSTTWMCCGKLSETDENGITTSYGYNSAHQLVEVIRSEVKDGDVVVTPETITTYTNDAAGRTLTTRRDIGAMTTTESTAYDDLGRVTAQTDVLGRVTTTAYSADGLTTTETTPAGATRITQRNLDGSTARVFGTAQREVQYSYTRNGNNLVTTTALANGSVLAQNITNGFEQAIVQAQPNTLGGFIYTLTEYNAKGQMVKQYQNTGEDSENTAPTLLEYNSFGKQVKQTLALVDTPTKDNSPVAEMAYSVESAEDGVYSVTTQTRYNAAGEPLSATQKQLISQLSETLASKIISTDVRGNSSISWSEYTAPTKVTSFSIIPTSEITAEAINVDGFTISQKNHVGIITTASRSYTASGMTLVQVDGRGNATTTAMDQAGRTISVTDAAGAITTTAYDIAHDLPSVVTDAMGNTSCYKYDLRGRKIAEWGTALQPACFGYDDMNNMTSLRTFRADGEVITTDPSERSDYDETTWAFHATTGLEMSKTYADNTSALKTYDAYNRLATETDARGNVKTYSYEYARGLHLSTAYTVVDGTAATSDRSFSYNHLGQMLQLVDDCGTRTFGYNTYGERETDSLVVDGDTHLISETRDSFGRSTGYTYTKNGAAQQTVCAGYGDDGRICSAGFLHGGEAKNFGYTYLAGTNLLQVLTKPNGMTLTQTYETTRNLLTGMAYHRGSTLVAQREYTYDILGRPIARNTSRQGLVVNDTFTNNTRSELVDATVSGKDYEYVYDNIGNRLSSMEDNVAVLYDTNELNQYVSVSENGAAAFEPQFDADGNQTLIKTSTGIWSTVYNAENRPVSFTNTDTGTVVECAYDSTGRRAYKKVIVNGSIALHQRYIYRAYLQIGCVDLTRSHHPALWYITWDPSQPVATRPLAIQINSTWYTYGWDLAKNVCEVFSVTGHISTAYTYPPFGEVVANGNVTQPLQWSSEFLDAESGLTYYNYRYYNHNSGRWTSRDLVDSEAYNFYRYIHNKCIDVIDVLGLLSKQEMEDKVNKANNELHQMVNNEGTSYPYCYNTRGCVTLTIIVDIGTPLTLDRYIGHVGMGIGNEFYDFGPEHSVLSLFGTGGAYWSNPEHEVWDDHEIQTTGRPVTLQDIRSLQNLQDRLAKLDAVVEIVSCVCEQNAANMKKLWQEHIDDWYTLWYSQCASQTRAKVNETSDLDYISPRDYLSELVNSGEPKIMCGKNKGKKPFLRILKEFTLPQNNN